MINQADINAMETKLNAVRKQALEGIVEDFLDNVTSTELNDFVRNFKYGMLYEGPNNELKTVSKYIINPAEMQFLADNGSEPFTFREARTFFAHAINNKFGDQISSNDLNNFIFRCNNHAKIDGSLEAYSNMEAANALAERGETEDQALHRIVRESAEEEEDYQVQIALQLSTEDQNRPTQNSSTEEEQMAWALTQSTSQSTASSAVDEQLLQIKNMKIVEQKELEDLIEKAKSGDAIAKDLLLQKAMEGNNNAAEAINEISLEDAIRESKAEDARANNIKAEKEAELANALAKSEEEARQSHNDTAHGAAQKPQTTGDHDSIKNIVDDSFNDVTLSTPEKLKELTKFLSEKQDISDIAEPKMRAYITEKFDIDGLHKILLDLVVESQNPVSKAYALQALINERETYKGEEAEENINYYLNKLASNILYKAAITQAKEQLLLMQPPSHIGDVESLTDDGVTSLGGHNSNDAM